MTAKLDYMPWMHRAFILDDRVQTQLTDNMKWWFLRLLAHQWDHGAVPLDGNTARCIVNPHITVRRKEWIEWVEKIPEFFPPLDEYLGQNPTLEEVREQVVESAEARSEHGRHAASIRWAKQRAMLEHNASNTQGHAQPHAPDAKGKGEGEGEGEDPTPPPTKRNTKVDADASARNDFRNHHLGVIRECWPAQALSRKLMHTNGSILSQMYGKVSGELEPAIRGLPLARPNTMPSMRLLWSKKIRDEVFTDAVRAHHQSLKEKPQTREGQEQDPQHISTVLDQIGVAR